MKKNIVTLVIVAALTIAATANAVTSPANFYKIINMDGFQINMNGANQDAWYHQNEQIPEKGHWHEARSNGSINIKIKQGHDGKDYLPYSTSPIIQNYGNGMFQIGTTFKAIYVDQIWADYLNIPSDDTNWNLGELNFNTRESFGHKMNWDGNVITPTTDLEGYFSYSFENTVLRDTRLSISEWQLYNDGKIFDGIRIDAWYTAVLTRGTEQIRQFDAMFAPVEMSTVPEPATMLLLGLGGLFLRRRRR